ncbi:MAG: twin-arginine translocation signal domain-containing protein, partial [Patescibacteria group bacterium]|nr:twin-arginine translocation signal domain-containing protein [Patescibacteria group bacterium]
MPRNISRRDFLKVSGALAASAMVNLGGSSPAAASAAPAKRWFKGNLHMHNQWSDGQPLPEWAVDWYKSNGYDFICPSDHNIFQSDALRFDGFKFENPPSDLAPFKGETSLWKIASPKGGWAKR